MRAVARLGDKTFGTCTAHVVPISIGGTIITGSADTLVNGLPIARLGDQVLTDCGHTSVIVTADSSTPVNSKPGTARLGDSVGDGPYTATIITASKDTFVRG
jgi:uncharacterized Zn-binding protein involved in type VI secretion